MLLILKLELQQTATSKQLTGSSTNTAADLLFGTVSTCFTLSSAANSTFTHHLAGKKRELQKAYPPLGSSYFGTTAKDRAGDKCQTNEEIADKQRRSEKLFSGEK